MSLSLFQPAVRAWFEATFGEPTEAQRLGWPSIANGRSTLLLAPTGSGKTLAAFLAALDRLFHTERGERGRVLYVSPLKALGVDVHRNLEIPIAGIDATAKSLGLRLDPITIGVRSGDTPSSERARLARAPPDILITTPESLYLMLTSAAKDSLAAVDTVIVDEIHSMVASKRGVHLFLSLERLEELRGASPLTDRAAFGSPALAANVRRVRPPLQRIGLSATQRPLDEVARLLGGYDSSGRERPVEIIDAGRRKRLELSIELPAAPTEGEAGSVWPSIHPRIVDLIRAHRSTLVFVNNRALSERLAEALNELAKEPIALAHHGSIAKETRKMIEERLKAGELRAVVATSSLELGIDMGAIDLVIQIEAPPSVASGLQRIGRSGHQVGAVSRGVLFPKFKGDLLASAAAVERMHEGLVEETFYPRNALDVLAQQIVAHVAMSNSTADGLFQLVRRAAPYADLSRRSFESVLDMLSGRYPSDRFADLRPRITWDRATGKLEARQGAKRVAVVNGGTIPDRGLFGVFLADGERSRPTTARAGEPKAARAAKRIGELDEEMVFESRAGDVFTLGASSWRIEEIDHDRVLVTPAPGEPGRLPFWRGDRPGRPLELGRAIGALARRLLSSSRDDARSELLERGLEPRAADTLLDYLASQQDATGAVPSDETIVIETFTDEVGDFRICLLSPFGSRVHAPWATAVAKRLGRLTERSIDLMWTDDGIAFRLPASDQPPDSSLFLIPASEVRDAVADGLDETALFAARFRENAGRALLLTKRRPGKRAPLWATRRRAADLLAVASELPDFPIVLETYRECLSDAFDLDGLIDIATRIETRAIRVATVRTRAPSPFASALLFTYVASFIYDTDAPLAERRAQALRIDHGQLRELLGEAALRELLDPKVIHAHVRRLQHLDRFLVKHADGLHDLLLSIGDLSRDEIRDRSETGSEAFVDQLLGARRAVEIQIGREARLVAVEDAARHRDGIGTAIPDLPAPLADPVANALVEIIARYARTHGPFTAKDAAARFDLPISAVELALSELVGKERVVHGDLLPGGTTPEYCDAEVLKDLRRISLSEARKEVEPKPPAALQRFLLEWHGIGEPRRGLDALLDCIEQLQAAPLLASDVEDHILPARIAGYQPSMLDELCAAGEVMWRGIERVGANDARIALYLSDRFEELAPPMTLAEGQWVTEVRAQIESKGALFYSELASRTKAFQHDLIEAIWSMVFAGELTNDTLAPLRSLRSKEPRQEARGRFRSRRPGPPGSEGRWSLLVDPSKGPTETEKKIAVARQLLARHGVLCREAFDAEGITGGFSSLYPILKAMEERGRVRRGWFVAELAATQFAIPGADDRLRSISSGKRPIAIAATDPANGYGAVLPWPDRPGAHPQRTAGAQVVLSDGEILGWLGPSGSSLLTFCDDSRARELTSALRDFARGDRAIVIERIDGASSLESPWSKHLEAAGFRRTGQGYLGR